ncbi:MAG: hypothetical protein LIR50_03335 [Bacillota bacterium]|nr:hypothetical protein [Bacillota bacterium]
MKKISGIAITICIISVCVFGFIYYTKSHTIVSPEINLLYIDDMTNLDKPVKVWLKGKENTQGIFLGKFSKEDNSNEYYLCVNNMKISDVEIKPYKFDGVAINVTSSYSDLKKQEVFRIKERNKKIKYIILNGNKFDISSIKAIN